jgi:F-type H+-transporting ATPase subunit delta
MRNNINEEYALAFSILGIEENKAQKFYNELINLKVIFKENNELMKLLNNDYLDIKEKENIINDIFANDFDLLITNFLKLLVKNKLIREVVSIFELTIKRLSVTLNILEVIIETPFGLSQEQILNIENKVQNKTKSKIISKIIINKDLIGGIKIKFDSFVIDGSIKNKLENLYNIKKEEN